MNKAAISISELIKLARGLKSEHGENPEYDRALVELVTDASGLPMESKEYIARKLGIKSKPVYVRAS